MTAGVVEGGPLRMMGVDIAEDEGVAVGVSENVVETRRIPRRAGGRRRNVDAVDVERMMLKLNSNGDDFDDTVVEGRDVDRGEAKVVMNKDPNTAPTANRTITTQERIIDEIDGGSGAEFRLLQTSDLNILVAEVDFEFVA